MHRFEWPDNPGVEFHLGFGDWVRLLRANGFEVIDFIEVQAPVGVTASAHALVEWARKWPAEQIWKVRKGSSAG